MNDSPASKIILKTASAVIDALGGSAAVARLCGASIASVTNWRARGRLAPRKFLIVQAALAEIGAAAPPALWSIDETNPENLEAGI